MLLIGKRNEYDKNSWVIVLLFLLCTILMLDYCTIGLVQVEVIEDSDSDDAFEEDDHEDGNSDEEVDVNPFGADRAESSCKYSCVMCGKSFNHEANLKVHIRVHLGMGAALNTCDICKR